MAAYIMSAIDIHDKKKFDQTYFPAIVEQVERYGARLLAASDRRNNVIKKQQLMA